MRLIVGLGNPGKQYNKTRHNIGFMVLDKLATKLNMSDFVLNKKFNSEITETKIDGRKIILAKPQTFMNESGIAVRSLVDFYKLDPTKIIVIHDDKDIELGKTKIQNEKSAAGHNGVQSIITHLNTNNFTRLRIGVANKHLAKNDTAKFVLAKFGLLEKGKLNSVVNSAVEEIEKMIN